MIRPPESRLDPAEWIKPIEPLSDRVEALTTARSGGVSRGSYQSLNLATHVGDDAQAVAENRQRVLEATGLTAIAWLEQVHGSRVVRSTAATLDQTPAADALWTDEPGIGLGILTADCLPVVLAAADGGCVGIAHAGWRGLLGGVLEALLEAVPGVASDYRAWIGPAISQPSYEIGEDVAAQVRDQAGGAALSTGRVEGKYQLDLAGLAAEKLRARGVAEVFCSGICSLIDDRCYSYRRDGQTGRMATLAWLR